MAVQTATAMRVIERRTGSRRIRGMPVAAGLWQHQSGHLLVLDFQR